MTEIETLKKLGLTDYEAKIALALLKLGPSKVREIYKECYVPKNKIYECLDNLIKKAIIEVLPTIPKRYLIKNINSLDNLIKKKEKDLEVLKKDLYSLKKLKLNNPSSSKESVLIIYGHEPFLTKLKESLSKVSKENLILARKLRTDPVIIRLTKEAIKRGAEIRMLLPSNIEKSKAREWEEIGVKIRFLKENPSMPFSTFDNFTSRINLNVQDNVNDPTLWIDSAQFIQVLREKFNNIWKSVKK